MDLIGPSAWPLKDRPVGTDRISPVNVSAPEGNVLKSLTKLVPLSSLARSCGQPQDPANGYHAGECYTFGCRITHHCAPGYELVGKQERFCQADGSWTPKETPTCVCEYPLISSSASSALIKQNC